MEQRNLRMVSIWLALTALFALGSASAAVPESISYQGYLTDRFGAPNNETKQIAFAIYNVPAGGSPLWSDVQTVPMFQGLFSLELGNAANPFPVEMFDTPLWLGMTIEDDSEMSPRRPLTSVGFAFKADDALSLQGLTPASLDQSDHVDDVGNPHGVSAAQIGAASEVALIAHAGNTANPHLVTAADVGAASAGDFVTHEAAGTAHHTRYSDAEAIASMDGVSDGNPLNHTKYQDGQAVAAVLAADGPGSGLDADLVDGLDVDQIIGAVPSAIRLLSNDAEIGTVLVWEGDISRDFIDFTVLTTSGYLAEGVHLGESLGYPDGQIRLNLRALHFVGDDCTGQPYIETNADTSPNFSFSARQGFVFGHEIGDGVFENYYVPKNTTESVSVAVSSMRASGNCDVITLQTINAYEANLNDSLVTGFFNQHTGPFRLQR